MKKSVTEMEKKLIAENEELRIRLTETEEALYAIRTGEVDAIVVFGNQGEQVYSINSAETPYRTFIETMNEGAVTLSKEGVILYCNQRFAGFVHKPIELVIGSPINRFVVPDDKLKIDSLLTHLTQNKDEFLIISLINKQHLKLSFHLLPPYLGGDNCILIATDISELKKKEQALLELHRLLEKKLEQNRGLRIELINAKIDSDQIIKELMNRNEELFEEINKLKHSEEKLKHKKV